uniref:Uncharacterized protein n=1 Tax=Rhizophora mucronata TaxID=61149 RepID=A0A2P2NLJ5_RHIMU
MCSRLWEELACLFIRQRP